MSKILTKQKLREMEERGLLKIIGFLGTLTDEDREKYKRIFDVRNSNDEASLKLPNGRWLNLKPVYDFVFISSGWQPYGCPSGFKNINTGETLVIGSTGFSYVEGNPYAIVKNGKLFKKELIGWTIDE